MDDLDFGAQPHCPDDDVVMRDVPGGWECPECGHVQQAQDVEMPPEFDGPDIHAPNLRGEPT
jgi:hypothetical protein